MCAVNDSESRYVESDSVLVRVHARSVARRMRKVRGRTRIGSKVRFGTGFDETVRRRRKLAMGHTISSQTGKCDTTHSVFT